MTTTPLWNPLRVENPNNATQAVRPGYDWRHTDSAIRRGSRVIVQREGWVNVRMLNGHKKRVRKRYLIAVAAHGWPPYWTCESCRETVPYIPQVLSGDDEDTSPGNLKWVPDAEGELFHVVGCCLEKLMACQPHEERPGMVWGAGEPSPRDCNCFVFDEDGEYAGETHMFHDTTAKTEKFIQWE
jgi:hypothetical protein